MKNKIFKIIGTISFIGVFTILIITLYNNITLNNKNKELDKYLAEYKELKKEDYYRAVLTDEDDILNAIGKLKSIYPNLMSMEYDNTRTRSYSVVDNVETGETKSPLDYFEEFFELQNNQPMNEEQRKYSEDLIRKIQEVK